jgi:hypothetical protein
MPALGHRFWLVGTPEGGYRFEHVVVEMPIYIY